MEKHISKTPNIAEMRTEELQDDFDKLVLLKSMWQKELVEIKLKIKEAGVYATQGRRIPQKEYETILRRRVEISTAIDKAQIDMGRLSRELKSRSEEEALRKSNHAAGMTERLFMQIAKEVLQEEMYNEIFLQAKMRMLDI